MGGEDADEAGDGPKSDRAELDPWSVEAVEAQQLRVGAFAGLSKGDIEDQCPAETEIWLRAEQLRWNRTVRLVCWVLVQLPGLIYDGCAVAINNAVWGGKADLSKRDYERLVKNAPGFSAAAEEDDLG